MSKETCVYEKRHTNLQKRSTQLNSRADVSKRMIVLLRYAKYVKIDLCIRKETHKRDMHTERDLLTLSWCSGRWGV